MLVSALVGVNPRSRSCSYFAWSPYEASESAACNTRFAPTPEDFEGRYRADARKDLKLRAFGTIPAEQFARRRLPESRPFPHLPYKLLARLSQAMDCSTTGTTSGTFCSCGIPKYEHPTRCIPKREALVRHWHPTRRGAIGL